MSEDEFARIIGFRATGGPLFQAGFPIRAGLSVLYGLNGAGKSHLLDALAAVLSGRRVGLDGQYVDSNLRASLLVSAPEDYFRHRRSKGARDDSWRMWHSESIEKFDPYLRALHRQVEDENSWQATAPEPRTLGRPLWRVQPAVTPIHGTPAGTVFAGERGLWNELKAARSDRDYDLDQFAREWAPTQFPVEPGAAVTREDSGGLIPEEWAQEFFVDPGGAVFFSLLGRDEPSTDGLPVPVSELDEDYKDSHIPPLPGLRLLIEDSDPDASDKRTRLAVQELESTRQSVPTFAGWQVFVDVFEAEERGDDEEDPDEAEDDDGAPDGELPSREELQDPHVLQQMARAGSPEISIDSHVLRNVMEGVFLRRYLSFLEKLARDLLAGFLLDPPDLTLRVHDSPFVAYAGRQMEWQSGGRPLSRLSKAQKRWADLAIELALEATLQPPGGASLPSADRMDFQPNTFVLVDEPESALHRTAEAHMVGGLDWLSRQKGIHVIVATHSPKLIDCPGASVFRVFSRSVDAMDRSGVFSTVIPLASVHREELQSLGLEPSDLLRRSRVVLLVEGQHDEVLIEEFLSRELTPMVMGRLQVVAVRGARKLPASLDSRLLFDFTDATIVPIVDNVRMENLTEAWERAVVLAATDGEEAAGELIRRQLPASAASENDFISQFLSRAIVMGVHARVSPFSLPAADITDYLPVSAFVPEAKSWDELRAMHAAAVESGTTKEKYFKTWVSKRYSTDFSDQRIRTACNVVEGCPSDFQVLADLCARLCE